MTFLSRHGPLGPLSRLSRTARDALAIRRDPVAWSRQIGVRVGERCRLLGVNRATYGSEPYLIRLGDHVTVTEGVRFVTHDGGVWIFRDNEPDLDIVAPIIVGDNVFIGIRAIILPGVSIGPDSVIAAGAVVARDVDAGSVVGGVPAKLIKSVAEYRSSLQGKEFGTKNLTADEKKRRFSEFYGSEVATRLPA